MLKKLLKRQFVDDVMSHSFLLNFILILITVSGFALLFSSHLQTLQGRYSKNSLENERDLSEASKQLVNLLDVPQRLVLQPKPSRFISSAYEERIPQGLSFRLEEIRLLSQEETSSSGEFYSTDLAFVIRFLLSFFAVMLAFNAITAEKEKGTLRLIFSNPVKRAYLIMTKYLSALLTVALPLLAGLFLSLIILNTAGVISFSLGLVWDYILLFVIALIYVSFFILLSLFCSTLTSRSKYSLVLCLLFWIFFVVILPKSAGLLLNLKRFDVPTEKQIEELAEKAYRSVWDEHEGEDLVTRGGEEESTRRNVAVGNEAVKAKQDVYDHYLSKKIGTVTTLKKINCISPASLFEYAASSLAGTGLFHFQNFWNQVKQYQNIYTDFFKTEDMKDERSFHLFFHPDYLSRKPVDFNKIPKFEEKGIERGERIKDSLPYMGILILYNILLFALVFYKFLKYDVR
ncbi:MAG: ABC transporter permease subunit [Candidatus Aminicenantes bacterium]|jgi:ABC-2 type transport system permease protein